MKQSDPLELVEPDSLTCPGPNGRWFRLLPGLACLFALYHLMRY